MTTRKKLMTIGEFASLIRTGLEKRLTAPTDQYSGQYILLLFECVIAETLSKALDRSITRTVHTRKRR